MVAHLFARESWNISTLDATFCPPRVRQNSCATLQAPSACNLASCGDEFMAQEFPPTEPTDDGEDKQNDELLEMLG